MSQSKQIRTNLFKYRTKSKRKKQRFIFDLNEIDKRFHISQSTDKKENENINEKENINENEKYNIKINKILNKCNINTQEIIPLKNNNCIYNDWKKWNSIFEKFENELLDKKNYEINYDTFEIRTKNEKACEELKNEKFWILYSEYLKGNNKIKDTKDFMKIINLAFSYIEFGTKLLVYYLDKIKKYSPIIIDGKLEEKDGPYIDLLDIHVKNKINNLKENLSSNIKIKHNTYQKEMHNLNCHDEFTPFSKKCKK